ncbi:hypothetical protein [Tabrizicola sp.]|uniref:hypothetical protein n=1 Tax=Tabrizicola sp. TaxID=2005166 RepID=UPI001A5051F2|nr:hypothetical protein [Tabrizicola sp.]MBL9074619.1 hypothetical protein [Tabrizicola sp.]
MEISLEGIYTAYLTGIAGQGIAMFVFTKGRIAGADMAGLTFSGSYSVKDGRMVGEVIYTMPAGTISITGASFDKYSDAIKVPINLPAEIDPTETYLINTPIGPLNAKFVKNASLGP